ncbi:MAG: S-methyl-5-thioribose-1-phosphate isomerase [Methanolinea sp.]|nr:S-methyl-5-thioribose-1-phosphate isomerase [Methanolinea sp.]
MRTVKALWWDATTGAIALIDQTKLPGHCRVVRCRTVDRLVSAIENLEVRGAPALGIAGAYGVALAARRIRLPDLGPFLRELGREAERIAASRPTAVNLSVGVSVAMEAALQSGSVREARERTLAAADAFAESESRACHLIGDHGAPLVPDDCSLLTHCNAGALACGEWGTALGVVRSAVAQKKRVSVIACETRPLLQGARLTAWELVSDGIPVTVIPDSAAALMMQRGEVDLVVVGADRITRDAVFNKVGTYMHAICARFHGIPFYVAAPVSTFDPERSFREVTIEERPRQEVSTCGGKVTVPDGAAVRNYAFDRTPHDLVTAFITDIGILEPPLDWGKIARARATARGTARE